MHSSLLVVDSIYKSETNLSDMMLFSLSLLLFALLFNASIAFNIADYTIYLDYLPLRQEGLAGFEDFRTALNPPLALRNRKMELGTLKVI